MCKGPKERKNMGKKCRITWNDELYLQLPTRSFLFLMSWNGCNSFLTQVWLYLSTGDWNIKKTKTILLHINEFNFLFVFAYLHECLITDFVRNATDIFKRPACLVICFLDVLMMPKCIQISREWEKIILVGQANIHGRSIFKKQLPVTGIRELKCW